jgi:peptidoglycan hydrolase-like protein with peptidoglycan-binding domain
MTLVRLMKASFLAMILTTFTVSNFLNLDTQAMSVPEFTPDYVISDIGFRSTRVFNSESSIQNYLNQVNSPLKNYSDGGKSASYWIYNAARGVTSEKYGYKPNLNPALILTMLEKEQSLLSMSNYDTGSDPDFRIKSAMGYACPDSAKCDPDYKGFANQVNWGAFQLEYNFTNSENKSSKVSPYIKGNKIKTSDGYEFTISNSATAAVYRYTPHVYWGNYNLWKIMTAKGWGSSEQTFSYGDLENANPKSKNDKFKAQSPNPVITPVVETIKPPVKTELTECEKVMLGDYFIGQMGTGVRRLQECLRDAGHYKYSGGITGYFGYYTSDRLADYLNNPNTTCAVYKLYDFKIGMTGTKARAVQRCMEIVGYFKYPGGPTGYFGNISNEAFSKWRKT